MHAVARHPRWTRRRWVLVIGAVLVAIGAVAWYVAGLPARETDPGSDVVAVSRATLSSTVTLSGTLAPQEQANVSFAVPGTVSAIPVRVGDRVEQGQTLAVLDDRDLANAVALAEANAAAASAQLQTLRDSDAATSAQLAAARAQVAAAQASLTNARDRLADAVLASPLTGVVATVSLQVGDQVGGSSAPVGSSSLGGLSGLSGLAGVASGASSTATGAQVTVVVPGAWQLDASIGTADLPSLQPGQAAVVTPTGTSTSVTAVVDTVGIVASGASGSAATFPVTLTITGTGVELFSGANADAVVTTSTVPDVLGVPTAAVDVDGGRATVRRADGTTVEVTTGRRFGDRVEVLTGLVEGDEILVPRGIVVSEPPRPQFGPNGRLASPDPSPSGR